MRRVMNRLMLKPENDIFSAPCEQVADALVSKWKQDGGMEIHNLEGQLYKWSLESEFCILVELSK